MINAIFATKKEMSQIWDNQGKRVVITKCKIEPNYIIGLKNTQIKKDHQDAQSWTVQKIVEVGYGHKKLKNTAKPLRTRLTKLSLPYGLKKVVGLRELPQTEPLKLGETVPYEQIFAIGDIVKVTGETKGKGFAGGMKRHGFKGGSKTHGQSDRARAVGSIGSIDPSRVWLGQKMPGHMGTNNHTISGLTIAYLNLEQQEIWLTGPIPGSFNSIIQIKKTNKKSHRKFLPYFKAKKEKSDSQLDQETKEIL